VSCGIPTILSVIAILSSGGADGVESSVKDIQGLLANKVAARWYQMGVTLGARVSDLESIRVRKLPPVESEAMMLKAWLRNSSSTTWQRLVDAVGHAAGGSHLKLAKNLAKKKPSDGESDGAARSSSKAVRPDPSSTNSAAKTPEGVSSSSAVTTGRTGKLDINKDVHKAKNLLKHLKKEELKDLFVELGLFDATVLNNYSASANVYANDLVRAWVLGKDSVLQSETHPGGATWENLRSGLRTLDHHGVADTI
jgi:hypothetical protein